MRAHLKSHERYFITVALAFILIGAGIVAVGAVQWLLNEYSTYSFHAPGYKVMGGLVILALGYIHLELELIRTPDKIR